MKLCMNRPLRTRMVGGVGRELETLWLPDYTALFLVLLNVFQVLPDNGRDIRCRLLARLNYLYLLQRYWKFDHT